jgi:hypothetical protein
MGAKGRTVINNDILLLRGPQGEGFRKAVPCHRLDSETGGILVCSKNHEAHRVITDYFRGRLVHKTYSAIVIGKLPETEGYISKSLAGKDAITKYQVQECITSQEYGYLSRVHLWPITGRKHQIRRHLQSLGCPIIGDPRYTSALSWSLSFPYLFLWAIEIVFPNPKDEVRQMQEINAASVADGNPQQKRRKIVYESDLDSDNMENENEVEIDEEETDSGIPAIVKTTDYVAIVQPPKSEFEVDESGHQRTHEEFQLALARYEAQYNQLTAYDPANLIRIRIEEPPYYQEFLQSQNSISTELREQSKAEK